MGVVHAAQREDGLRVALKRIPRKLCSEIALQRFRRETRAVQAFEHPNVVRVVAAGEGEEDSLWIAMELLEGEDLSSRLRRGALPAQDVVRIARAAAAGLGAAHRAGIVHRDVKPANLFLCADGTVKVLDFGLAVNLAEVDQRVTGRGVAVGTPGYMAVEQVLGLQGEDPRTDVWGLGATLYRALSGRRPFRAESVVSEWVRIVHDDPDPLPPEVPRELAAAVLRCLRKDKSQRWQSMEELDGVLRDAPLVEGPRLETVTAPTTPEPPTSPDACTLLEEIRVVSLVLAEQLVDPDVFAEAVRAEGGVPTSLLMRHAIGVFGGDSWRGDEARRAVRAALAVRERQAALRLAVATGRGIQESSGRITGAVVSAAEARLDSQGVGADDETLRRVARGFALEGSRIVGRHRGRRTHEQDGFGGVDRPIVGRASELARLTEIARVALGGGGARGVELVGVPGAGKSRLVAELHRQLPPHAIVLFVQAHGPMATQAWQPWCAALRELLELPADAPLAVARRALGAVCPAPAAATLAGLLTGSQAPPAGPSPQAAERHDRVLAALVDLLEALAVGLPLVVLFEDLHWSDGPSRLVVELALRRLKDQPLLVVATTREPVDVDPALLAPIEVRPLADSDLSALAGALLGAPVDDPRVRDIVARAGGNALFAEELAIARSRGDSALPISVEAAVQTRLSGLSRPEHDLLRRASVLGRRFSAEALAVLGETDAEHLLPRLRRHELVAVEPTAGLDARWLFRHDLVREVTYGSLTEAQRRVLHRAAARWLASRADAAPAEVAWHLDQAGARTAAAERWCAAADRAFHDGDGGLVLEASERALGRRLPRDVSFRLRAMRTAVAYWKNQLAAARVEAAELSRLARSREERARAMAERARIEAADHQLEEAGRLSAGAVALDPRPEWLTVQATIETLRRRPDEGLAIGLRAREAARDSGDRLAEAGALHAVGVAYYNLSDAPRALAAFRECAAILDELQDDPWGRARAHSNVGTLLADLGQLEEAESSLDLARRLCVSCGRPPTYVLLGLATTRANLGDAEGARRWLREAEEESRLAQSTAGAFERTRALVALFLGEWLEALGISVDALESTTITLGPHATTLGCVRALALASLGRLDEARLAAGALVGASGGSIEACSDGNVLVAAAASGLPGATVRAMALLHEQASRIDHPDLRRRFLERNWFNARLLEVAARAR